MRQMLKNEGDEDVIGILALRTRAGLLQNFFCFIANAAGASIEFLDLGKDGKWERVYTPERFDYLKEPKSPIRLYPHIGVIQEFVDSIRERRQPKVGGPEGRAAVEMCEACLISARSGQAVNLPLQ